MCTLFHICPIMDFMGCIHSLCPSMHESVAGAAVYLLLIIAIAISYKLEKIFDKCLCVAVS